MENGLRTFFMEIRLRTFFGQVSCALIFELRTFWGVNSELHILLLTRLAELTPLGELHCTLCCIYSCETCYLFITIFIQGALSHCDFQRGPEFKHATNYNFKIKKKCVIML